MLGVCIVITVLGGLVGLDWLRALVGWLGWVWWFACGWLVGFFVCWFGFMRMDSIDLRWWFDDLCLILVLG